MAQAVTVSLEDLKKGEPPSNLKLVPVNWMSLTIRFTFLGTVPFSTLQEAFGPESLGILVVKDVPSEFADLRRRALSYASYLGNLPKAELGG